MRANIAMCALLVALSLLLIGLAPAVARDVAPVNGALTLAWGAAGLLVGCAAFRRALRA